MDDHSRLVSFGLVSVGGFFVKSSVGCSRKHSFVTSGVLGGLVLWWDLG
jgi:hypothetical protein